MANNRMYLRCTLCGDRFYLAKYYPSTGWYTNIEESFENPAKNKEKALEWFVDLQIFFENHSPFTRRDENGNISFRGQLIPHESIDASDLVGDVITMGETFILVYE